jgi:hypothetical protein
MQRVPLHCGDVAHAAEFGAKHFTRLLGLACVNFDFFNSNTAPFSHDEVFRVELTCDWDKQCVWILTVVRVATREERGGDVDAAVWAIENMNLGGPSSGYIFPGGLRVDT